MIKARQNTLKICFLFDSENDWIRPLLGETSALEKFEPIPIDIAYSAEDVIDYNLVFVLGFTRKLSQNFCDRNEHVFIVHESDLPAGRGFSPVQWQILEGKNLIPVCMIAASDEIDGGPVVFRSEMSLNGTELLAEIRAKQLEVTLTLIFDAIRQYPHFQFQPQQEGQSEAYPRRTPRDSELDINRSISEQFDLMRIASNDLWPLHFSIRGRKYILHIQSDPWQ